jgi:orotate phosphoribosyltransferase
MVLFEREEFVKFVIDHGVVGFFEQPVKLRSGRLSHWYANWRTIAGDAYLVDILSDFLIAFLHDMKIDFDTVYGVPDGATKLGIVTQFKWARRRENYGEGSYTLLMGRSAPKEHGVAADRFFLGNPAGRVIVVEDVTTTGGSLIRAIESLRGAGADVVAAVGLTNRMDRRDDGVGVMGAVAELDVPYFSMTDAHEVLPVAYERANPGDTVRAAVEQEFEKFGVKPLKLI